MKAVLSRCVAAGLAVVLAAGLTARPAAAAEIKVLVVGGMQVAMKNLAADYRKTGNNVDLTITNPANLSKDLAAGHYDAVAGARPSLTEFYKNGLLQRGMRARLARTGIGIAIKEGAPKPDLSTAAAFKNAVMKARNIVYTDPNTPNASGSVTHRILTKAKLLAAVTAKGKEASLADGRALIAKGDYEMGFFNVSEAVAPGVVLAGPVPRPLQQYTNYDIAVLKSSTAKKDAQAFVKFLVSSDAVARWKAAGLEPSVPHAKAKKK